MVNWGRVGKQFGLDVQGSKPAAQELADKGRRVCAGLASSLAFPPNLISGPWNPLSSHSGLLAVQTHWALPHLLLHMPETLFPPSPL